MKNNLNTMMSEYFNAAENLSRRMPASEIFPLMEDIKLPVSPSRNEWELLKEPTRLGRLFSFESREQLKFFLEEIFEHENMMGHQAKIIIEGNTVMVEIYTHDVNDVTELDTEYATAADEIYADALNAYE